MNDKYDRTRFDLELGDIDFGARMDSINTNIGRSADIMIVDKCEPVMSEQTDRVIEQIRAAQTTGQIIIIRDASQLDWGALEHMIIGHASDRRRSAQINTMMIEMMRSLEPEPCTDYFDFEYERPTHEPAPKRQSKPKNAPKQAIRQTMRSVNRNR